LPASRQEPRSDRHRTRDLYERIPGTVCDEIDAGHQAYFEDSEGFAVKLLAFADGLRLQNSPDAKAYSRKVGSKRF
jgi:hypothetical protein